MPLCHKALMPRICILVHVNIYVGFLLLHVYVRDLRERVNNYASTVYMRHYPWYICTMDIMHVFLHC